MKKYQAVISAKNKARTQNKCVCILIDIVSSVFS